MFSKKLSVQTAIGMFVVLAGLSACQKAPHEISENVLYEVMLRVDEKHCLTFNEFPEALEPVNGRFQGDIFTTNYGDTLRLVCRYPSLTDTLNRYPFYFMKDNHGHYWSMFHNNDGKYVIFREDPHRASEMFKEQQESLSSLKWLKRSHRYFDGAFSLFNLLLNLKWCFFILLVTNKKTNIMRKVRKQRKYFKKKGYNIPSEWTLYVMIRFISRKLHIPYACARSMKIKKGSKFSY